MALVTNHVATAAFGCPATAKPSGRDHSTVILRSRKISACAPTVCLPQP
jgi:hypothetical protein